MSAALYAEFESLESIARDGWTRTLLQRMADLSRSGGLDPFLARIERDADLDEWTKHVLSEIASNPAFLHEVDEFVRRTAVLH